jgi:hypothetical protein
MLALLGQLEAACTRGRRPRQGGGGGVPSAPGR